MPRSLVLALLVPLLAMPTLAAIAAQEGAAEEGAAQGDADGSKAGITTVRDTFLVALEAAKACGTVDPDARERWGGNFVLVMQGAARELAREAAGRSPDELMALDRARMDAVEREARQVVGELGCAHPSIRGLLELHRFHETLEVANDEPA
jgi:hypothetical protein